MLHDIINLHFEYNTLDIIKKLKLSQYSLYLLFKYLGIVLG